MNRLWRITYDDGSEQLIGNCKNFEQVFTRLRDAGLLLNGVARVERI